MKTVIYFLYLLLDDYYIYFSPEVQESAPSSLSSVFAFTSENPQGPLCHVDLSIKPNKPGNHTLCVKAKDQRFVKRFITKRLFSMCLQLHVLNCNYIYNSGAF